MANFNFSQTTGIEFNRDASNKVLAIINSRSWGPEFQDWTIDSDGDLEAIIWTADGRDALSFYLAGWRQESKGFRASELTFALTLDIQGSSEKQQAAFYTGNIYINRDFTGASGTVTSLQEQQDNGEMYYADGQWDFGRIANESNPAIAFDYLVSGNDEFIGSSERDVISGGDGADSMYGNRGNDYLYGGGDDDVIYGGEGSDQLIGGNGRNKLFGEQGPDAFYVQQGVSGFWTRNPGPNDTVWFTERRKIRIKGKRRIATMSWVDNNYDIIADFDTSEDVLHFKGGGSLYEYDVFPEGVAVFEAGTDNGVALLVGVSEYQYVNELLENAW